MEEILHEMDSDGCKSLMASVINLAIADAFSFKNPEKNKITKKKHSRKMRNIFLINSISSYMKFFDYKKPLFTENENLFFSFVISTMIDKCIDISMKKYSSPSKKKFCYSARKFLTTENPSFCFYLEMVGVDPEVAEERIKKHLDLFDKGELDKKILKMIKNGLLEHSKKILFN